MSVFVVSRILLGQDELMLAIKFVLLVLMYWKPLTV